MEMHQIRYFLAVCTTLNFTRGAEQCNVNQPALTRAIQKLEEEWAACCSGGTQAHASHDLGNFAATARTDLKRANRRVRPRKASCN